MTLPSAIISNYKDEPDSTINDLLDLQPKDDSSLQFASKLKIKPVKKVI